MGWLIERWMMLRGECDGEHSFLVSGVLGSMDTQCFRIAFLVLGQIVSVHAYVDISVVGE